MSPRKVGEGLPAPASGLVWNLNLGIASVDSRIHRRCNFCDTQSSHRPLRSARHHNRYFGAAKILLVSDVLVSGKKNVEPRTLRFGQQVAVGKRVPSTFSSPGDGVARKEPGNPARRSVVKENEQQQRSLQR